MLWNIIFNCWWLFFIFFNYLWKLINISGYRQGWYSTVLITVCCLIRKRWTYAGFDFDYLHLPMWNPFGQCRSVSSFIIYVFLDVLRICQLGLCCPDFTQNTQLASKIQILSLVRLIPFFLNNFIYTVINQITELFESLFWC